MHKMHSWLSIEHRLMLKLIDGSCALKFYLARVLLMSLVNRGVRKYAISHIRKILLK
jgi:hypothetical protein